MALKFVLVVALCAAQGFAHSPLEKSVMEVRCKKPHSESAKIVVHELKNTLRELDTVRETVSLALLDAFLKKNDIQVVIECFNKQKDRYFKLGEDIAGMIVNATLDMAKEFGGKYKNFTKDIEIPMKNISETIKSFPEKIWSYLEKGKVMEAFECLRTSLLVIEENSKILANIIKEMAKEIPKAGEEAKEKIEKIREIAQAECTVITKDFGNCIVKGGPS